MEVARTRASMGVTSLRQQRQQQRQQKQKRQRQQQQRQQQQHALTVSSGLPSRGIGLGCLTISYLTDDPLRHRCACPDLTLHACSVPAMCTAPGSSSIVALAPCACVLTCLPCPAQPLGQEDGFLGGNYADSM